MGFQKFSLVGGWEGTAETGGRGGGRGPALQGRPVNSGAVQAGGGLCGELTKWAPHML